MAFKFYIRDVNDKVSCNYVKEPRPRFIVVYQFFGPKSSRLTQIEERLVHSGIWPHYQNYDTYMQDLPLVRKRDMLEYEVTLPMRFTMLDWTIWSIFVACSVLLILCFLVVLAELLYFHLIKNIRVHIQERLLRFRIDTKLFKLIISKRLRIFWYWFPSGMVSKR